MLPEGRRKNTKDKTARRVQERNTLSKIVRELIIILQIPAVENGRFLNILFLYVSPLGRHHIVSRSPQ